MEISRWRQPPEPYHTGRAPEGRLTTFHLRKVMSVKWYAASSQQFEILLLKGAFPVDGTAREFLAPLPGLPRFFQNPVADATG